jgi:hypothetical protein
MKTTKPHIDRSRRKFLGTAAATVSLPFLPSLAARERRAHAAACAPPKRFLAWYVPNGIYMPDWTPTTTGKGWKTTPTLAPLEPYRSKLMVITGLENQQVALPRPPPNDHAGGTGCFLTQRRVNANLEDPNRTSLDQVIAESIGACTNLPSLQLGIEASNSTGNCDGANCAFSRCISWSKNSPLPNITRPQVAFDRLFAGMDKTASRVDADRRRALRTSVLDHAREEARLLSMQLAAADRRKLDEYTTGVRELETRIQKLAAGGAAGAGACTPSERPAESLPFAQHLALSVDLMALAFQCDITRVITFMTSNSQSGRDYGFIGASGGHHAISHHLGSAAQHDKLKKIDRWNMEQIAALLKKLDGMMDSNGKTVLDNTCVYFSSEISDGDRHNHWDLPTLLAGGLGGSLAVDGSHVSYTQMAFPRPLVGARSEVHVADLFLTILRGFGITMPKFGDNGTKILEEVAA